MRLFRNSVSYLDWKDYAKLIREREMLDFIHSTTLESYRNILRKEGVRWIQG